MNLFSRGRRRKMVVDRRFQTRAALVGMIYILAVAVCLSLPLLHTMNSIGVLLVGRGKDVVDYYRTQQYYSIAALVLFFVGVLGAWALFEVWRTHKIAGPLVKITRHVHQFATGDFTDPIQLREKDQLQALAQALNNMAEDLRERDRAIQEELLGQIDAVKRTLRDNPSADSGLRAVEQLSASVVRTFETARDAPAEKTEEELVYS